jgi:methylated-DNA-[protein]-cysteine S-methyltransferase
MHTFFDTPLGRMVLTSRDGDRLSGAYFEAQKHFPSDLGPAADCAVFRQSTAQLKDYFAGKRTQFALPLAPDGTAFQQLVWQQISAIGFGDARSYGELALALNRPNSARAVGAATGRNPLSIIVPCHRVIATSGALTGYAGGLDRKRALLALESRLGGI